jgi:hypothetical protein
MTTRRSLLLCLASVPAITFFAPLRPVRAGGAKPPVALFKNPGCECCDGYAAYLRQHGFTVTVKETPKLADISARAGIPTDLQGCHTAFLGGYVVDGHVPIEAIERLLAEQPAVKGLALPGMPPGSPGMAGDKQAPFAIQAIDREGKPRLYMTI